MPLPIRCEVAANLLLADCFARELVAVLAVHGDRISRDPLPHEPFGIRGKPQPEVLVNLPHRVEKIPMKPTMID